VYVYFKKAVVAVVAVVVARKSLIYKGFLQPPLFGTMKKSGGCGGKSGGCWWE
jgi:hypothetical protein